MKPALKKSRADSISASKRGSHIYTNTITHCTVLVSRADPSQSLHKEHDASTKAGQLSWIF